MVAALSNLWNHCGSDEVGYEDLAAMTPPEETATYTPLAHETFAYNTHTLGRDILGQSGFTLASEKYLVSKDRQKLFFMLAYSNGTDGVQMIAAGRNSYDKSMSAGVAIGDAGKVTVCDNLVIAGQVVVMQKHTKNLFNQLRKNLIVAFHEAKGKWRDLQHDIEMFKDIKLDEKDAHHFLVEAGREKALSKTIFFDALAEYHNPSYVEFEEPTLWALYNNVTEAMKKVPYTKTLETHFKFHDFARDFAGHKEVVSNFTYNEPPVEEEVH